MPPVIFGGTPGPGPSGSDFTRVARISRSERVEAALELWKGMETVETLIFCGFFQPGTDHGLFTNMNGIVEVPRMGTPVECAFRGGMQADIRVVPEQFALHHFTGSNDNVRCGKRLFPWFSLRI